MNKFTGSLQIVLAVLVCAGAVFLLFYRPAEATASGKTDLTVKGLNVGFWSEGMAAGVALSRFQEEHPGINLRPWTSFRIPGDLDVASELMSFAAQTAPDVTFTYIHRLQFYIEQGFYKKLNPFIGEDTNGDGYLADNEIRWKPWLDIPPMFRAMGMRGSDIYAIPVGNYFSLMAFRPDLLAAAGLPTETLPKDFDSFLETCQRICAVSLARQSPRQIYALPRNLGGFFHLLLLSAGGSPGLGILKNQEGVVVGELRPHEILAEKALSLGFRANELTVDWKVVFDDQATREALEAIWKLCWQPWILSPATGRPLNLTEADLQAGAVLLPETGKTIALEDVPGGVQRGVCRPARASSLSGESDMDLLRQGELAILPLQNTSFRELGRLAKDLGFALPPALKPGGEQVVVAIPMLYGLNAILDGKRLQAGWDFLAFRAGPPWKRAVAEDLLKNNHRDSVSPLDLDQLGLVEETRRLPEQWVNVNRAAMRGARVIPYFKGYQQAETEFYARTVAKIQDTSDNDIPALQREVQRDVEQRILRPVGQGRGWLAYVAAAALLVGSTGALAWGIKSVSGLSRSVRRIGPQRVDHRKIFSFWILVFPAVASVLVWNYYPMIRGFLLAFQDYRLTGGTEWIGLTNFVEGVWSPRFWFTLGKTLQFTAMNVALGFATPIILAVMLHEIPVGKYLFRTAYFLPSVTSSLVIMLLWTSMYDPSPEGVLNELVHPLIQGWNAIAPAALDVAWPLRWLQSPALAMICVITPGVWASMGVGCLIYLAALQSVSTDLYEAAEIDGAGFWRKLTCITLPYLKPLLIINLVGTFIGSAQAWSNIFVMTGGGPDLATQVAALEIWMNSFLFLRFGLATAQAWVLGAMLIGFTVWQIKQMQRVDFRRAEGS